MHVRGIHKVLFTGLAFVALAGCTPAAPRPAMVSIDQTDQYGYATAPAGEDRFVVEYVTPELATSTRDTTREQEIEEEKARAYDLALWRAAQIAQERGYAAFIVEESSRDADVSVDYDRYGGYGDPWFNQFSYGYHPYPYRNMGYHPYFPYHPYAYNRYQRSEASMLLRVKLLVREASPDEPGAFDTAATATRLAATYANATWPSR
ncbi:MAG: hypothetical protein WD044_13205 [Dongiaceae bacterium]